MNEMAKQEKPLEKYERYKNKSKKKNTNSNKLGKFWEIFINRLESL